MEPETPETDALLLANGRAIARCETRPPIWDTMRRLEIQRNAAFEILREVVRKDEEAIKELASMMDDYEPEQGCIEIHARIKALLGENA